MSKAYKQTIYIKTVLDASNTLEQAKKLRDELGKKISDKSLFSGLDKQLIELEDAFRKLNAQEKAGFSSDAEMRRYEKSLNQVNLLVHQVANQLSDIGSKGFQLDTKDAEKQIKALKKQMTDMQSIIAKTLKSNKDLSQESAAKMFSAITSGDVAEVKKVYASIQRQASAAVKKQTNLLRQTKEQILDENAGGALDKPVEGVSALGARASFIDSKTKGFSADLTRILGEKGGYTKKISASGYKIIDDAYKAIIADAKELKDLKPEMVFKKLNEVLASKYNITLGKTLEETDALYEQINYDISSVSESQQVKTQKKRVSDAEKRKANIQGRREIFVTQAEDLASMQAQLQGKTSQISQQTAAAKKGYESVDEAIRQLVGEYEVLNQSQHDSLEAADQEAVRQSELSNAFDNLKRYVSSYLSIGAAISQVRKVINETWTDSKNLDEAFASIAMVTDYSVEQMWSSYDQYSEMAQQLGQRTEDVIKSSALFYQ